MLRQCAGCGTVFDDKSGKPDQVPRPYGCCDECNKTTFRSKEAEAPKESVSTEE